MPADIILKGMSFPHPCFYGNHFDIFRIIILFQLIQKRDGCHARSTTDSRQLNNQYFALIKIRQRNSLLISIFLKGAGENGWN